MCVSNSTCVPQGSQTMWLWGSRPFPLTKASSSTTLSFLVWDVVSLPCDGSVFSAFISSHCDCLLIWKTDYSNIHFQLSREHLELLVKGHLPASMSQEATRLPAQRCYSCASGQGCWEGGTEERSLTGTGYILCRARYKVNAWLLKKKKTNNNQPSWDGWTCGWIV